MIKFNSIRNKQTICLFLFFFFLLTNFNFVSGIECDFSLPPVKINTCKTLIQTCSNCTFVNVTTIYYPNGTALPLNAVMTQNVNNYNYNFCSNTHLGTYVYSTLGNPDGTLDTGNVCYQVTTTGNDSFNIIPIFLLIAGFLLFALAVYQRQPIVGFASGVLLSIAGVYFLIYGLGVIQDVYTQALGFVSLFIGLIIAFASIYEQFTDGGEAED